MSVYAAELPTISVITPNLNQGEFIRGASHSVLQQNYPNPEYIIMDAGSSDQSVQIIETYQDRMTYWVSGNDRGQSHCH